MSASLLKRVHALEQISAGQHNLIVQLLKREITGPDVQQTNTGWHIRRVPGLGSAAASMNFVIVREIVDPTDIYVKVEKAARGHNFAVPGEDYGRWTGAFEYARTADPPPDPPLGEGDQPAYLSDMLLAPHMIAGEYSNFLWPFANQSGGWGDSDKDLTDILLAVKKDVWVCLPIPLRIATSVVLATTAAGDCVPEEVT